MIDEVSLDLVHKVLQFPLPVPKKLSQEGLPILLVEQLAADAIVVTERAYVMEHGETTITGPSRQLAHDSRVIEADLGKKAA